MSNRKISATDSNKKANVKHIRGGGGGENPASKRKGIHMPDGSIWTGYYSDWDTMPEKDKNTVMKTRKKNKAKGGTPHRLWDCGLQWTCDIQNRTSNKSVDISDYLDLRILRLGMVSR
jgi:hypothetical protein